jgi:hypothetical protein
VLYTVFSTTAFSQYNYIQKLGSLATVALPGTPKFQKVSGTELYAVRYQGVIFVAQAGDVHGGLKDIFTGTSIDSIYDNYIHGALTSLKGKLFYKDKIKINGHDGIEFGYAAKINGKKAYFYQHVVNVNDTLLMAGILSSDSLSKNEQHLKVFFNGFKVKTAQQLSDDHVNELGRKTGKTIAILVFLSIPILIGIGVIFIIRKIAYRKKDNSISV